MTTDEVSAYFSTIATKRHEQRREVDREAARKLADHISASDHLFTPEQAWRAYEIIRKGCKHYRPEQ